MKKLLKVLTGILVVIVVGGIGAGLYNDYDVQRRGNGPDYDPTVPVLRTPDAAFEELTDFPFEPHYIEINDADLGQLRVHYLDEGPADGEVVLLLHGQATWSYSYRKFIPILTAAGYRVIVPDLIGFGRSDKPADWEAHTFQKQVDWLDATLNKLQIKNATAFMFDWGGYFGLRLAADQPELFSRVLLVTTTMPRAGSITGALWIAGWRRYIYGPDEFPISGMVNDMTGNAMDAPTLVGLDAPYPTEAYKGGPRRMPLMIPATPLHPAHQPNQAAWEKLASWDQPAVVLVAESLAQRGFKPEEFYAQLPGTEGQAHQLYPDAGFFLIEDRPEQLAEKTIAFIQANPLETGVATTPPRAEKVIRWSLRTPTGDTVNFPNDRDAPAVLLFWASWCPYCKALMPHLQDIADEFSETFPGGLPVYAINFRDDKGDPQGYMEKNNLTYTLLLEGGDVADAYGVYGTPGVLIFDKDYHQVFNLYDLAERFDQEIGTPAGLKHSQKAARKAPWWADRIREALSELAPEAKK